MSLNLLQTARARLEVPSSVSDETLLDRLEGVIGLVASNPTFATALRGGYSEVVGFTLTKAKATRYRVGHGLTKRDGLLLDEHASLNLEIKRLGTKSFLYKRGPLTGKTLFEMKSRKNPGSAGTRSSGRLPGVKESTYTVEQIDVFASFVNVLDDTFYFASYDIVESGDSLHETCYLDLDNMLLYCVQGGPTMGRVTKVAPLYNNPDDAADRQRLLKMYANFKSCTPTTQP